MQNVRRLKYIKDKFPKKTFNSAFFNIFNEKVKPIYHSMDTNLEAYHKVVEEVIIPDCMEFARDVKGYPERMKKFIKHAHPAYDKSFNFTPELTYKFLAPPEKQTPVNLRDLHIIRGALDMGFTMAGTIDDVGDNATLRMHKKSWHTFCEGGGFTAVYDGSVYGYLAFYILKKHFRTHPSYKYMIEKFAEVNAIALIGQIADTVSKGKLISYDDFHTISVYKGGGMTTHQVPITMAFLGIVDEKLLDQMSKIFGYTGVLIQAWDDFGDYFCNAADFGEVSTDIPNGTNTWPSVTAMEYFNSKQKEIFKGCYGSSDPDKIEQIRKLYDEIDLPRKYIEYMRQSYVKLSHQIEKLPDIRLKNLSYSWFDWMIGDVNDANYPTI